jgi:hypothetical protein
MTGDDVLRMAQEAGGLDLLCAHNGFTDTLIQFAALVASERDIGWHKIVHDECEAAIKEEREAILQMSANNWYKTQKDYDDAIRARGETK